jgi:hypothetical protein
MKKLSSKKNLLCQPNLIKYTKQKLRKRAELVQIKKKQAIELLIYLYITFVCVFIFYLNIHKHKNI